MGIVSMGMYVPEKIIENRYFEKIVDTSDEWIRTRTGIEERRFANEDEATSDLAIKASRNALKNGNISAEEIDMIILATSTPDYGLQNTACIVQGAIGAINAAAVDINAACSGFVYGIAIAKGLVSAGINKKVMVIGAEVMSKAVDMKDRNTCVLFGDGAAAAIVSEVENGFGILSEFLGAEEDSNDVLRVPAGGTRTPLTLEGLEKRENYIQMKGQEVFKFAVKSLPKATLKAMEKIGLEAKDIDMVVPHQANVRIIESASKRLNIPMEKFYMNLQKYGNTSSASVGLALSEAVEEGKIKKGDIVVLTGFGAGLTYGSVILKWCY